MATDTQYHGDSLATPPEDKKNQKPVQGLWWDDEVMLLQEAARIAVMEMPLFPGLSVALKKATGYGPHVDMLQHFVYWFHPRHKTMQKRWTLYKTLTEWRVECGLSERQVRKGRERLGELGLMGWKLGQYKRLHYRVNWVKLAEILGLNFNLDTVGVEIGDSEGEYPGPEEEFNPDTKASRFNPDTVGVESNTGDYEQKIRLTDEEELVNTSSSEEAIEKRDSQERQEPSGDDGHSEDGGALKAAYAQEGVIEKLEGEDLLSEVRVVLNPEANRYLQLCMQVPDWFTIPKVISYARMVEEHLGEESGVVPRPEMLAAVKQVMREIRQRGAPSE